MNIATLIIRLKKGENQAYKELVFSYSSKLLTTAKVYCYNLRDAEDVLQEAIITIFQKMHTFQGETEANLLAWMRTIVRNKCFNRNRSKSLKLEVPVGEFYDTNEIQPEVLSSLSCDEIMNMVFELPAGYRQVFALYAIEGYSHKEIAELLDITVGGSRSQLARAKKSLQVKFMQLSKIEVK